MAAEMRADGWLTESPETEIGGLAAFEVATGQPGDPTGFARHGHLVRLVVVRG